MSKIDPELPRPQDEVEFDQPQGYLLSGEALCGVTLDDIRAKLGELGPEPATINKSLSCPYEDSRRGNPAEVSQSWSLVRLSRTRYMGASDERRSCAQKLLHSTTPSVTSDFGALPRSRMMLQSMDSSVLASSQIQLFDRVR